MTLLFIKIKRGCEPSDWGISPTLFVVLLGKEGGWNPVYQQEMGISTV